nr:hypothetical protein [uncultured Carboxylicivirga sp.]
MKKIILILIINWICLSVFGQEVQYRKRYIHIPNDSSVDDLANKDRSGTVAYELDGYVSGGGLSSENFQVLDVGVSSRRFQLVRNWKFNELYFRSTNLSGQLSSFNQIWHSGNSNRSDKNWLCNNLTVSGQASLTSLSISGVINASGIKMNNTYNPDPDYYENGNYITFRHPNVSEDFIGYRNNTFYFKDCLGGGDTKDPNIYVGGNITSGKKIKAEEIQVELMAANNITYTTNGQTADHVFEENYNLRSLEEIEAFILKNKHLPDIPSAAAMDEKGVNLAEMNKLLLQKVEELTLYMLQQQKEIDKLKSIVK